MADLSQTPANVRSTSDTQHQDVTAGEAGIQPGMPVYRKASDSKYYRCDADAEATASCDGIAMTYADADDPLRIATGGTIDLGGTLTVGEIYILSSTTGAIAPVGDLSNPMYTTILGIATAAGAFLLAITASDTVRA